MNDLLYTIPDIPGGAELDVNGWFEIVLPEESINLFPDPASWYLIPEATNISSTVEQSTSTVRRGRYSIKVSYTAGADSYIGIKKFLYVENDGVYTFSFDLKGIANFNYYIHVTDSTETFSGITITHKASGEWERVSYTLELDGSTEYFFYVEGDASTLNTFYVDGFQCENKGYATTFFDGNSTGYLYNDGSYKWEGRNKYITSSIRSKDTSSGGKPVNLNDYGLQIISVAGLGLPEYSINKTELSSGGAFYQNSVKMSRSFSLVAQLTKDGFNQYQQMKKELQQAFFVERTAIPQEITLRYHVCRKDGTESRVVNIPCIYSGGLGGSTTNIFGERIAITFEQTRPVFYEEGNEASEMDVSVCYEDGYYYVAQRNDDGSWEKMGSGFNDEVLALLVTSDNQGGVYAGGLFTQSGTTACGYIAKWDESLEQWTQIDTGVNDVVRVIKQFFYVEYWGDDEKTGIVFGGDFTEMIAQYDVETDTITGTAMAGLTGVVHDILVDGDVIYYVGEFTTATDTHNNICYSLAKDVHDTQYPVYYSDNGVDDGVDGIVYAITKSTDNTIYAVGEFTMYPIDLAEARYVPSRVYYQYETANNGTDINGNRSFTANPAYYRYNMHESFYNYTKKDSDFLLIHIHYYSPSNEASISKIELIGADESNNEYELSDATFLQREWDVTKMRGVETWYLKLGNEDLPKCYVKTFKITWTKTAGDSVYASLRPTYYTNVDLDSPFVSNSVDTIATDITGLDGLIKISSDAVYTDKEGNTASDPHPAGTAYYIKYADFSNLESTDTITLNGTWFQYAIAELKGALIDPDDLPVNLNRFIRVEVDREKDIAGYYAVTDQIINDTVYTIESDEDGNVYLGGKFTLPYNLIAKWNGITFEEVGGSLYDDIVAEPYVSSLIYEDERLYAFGDFSYAGDGKKFYNSGGYFYKTNWHNMDVKFPGYAIVNDLKRDGNKTYFAFNSEGKMVKPMTQTIGNVGNSTYPTIITYYPFVLGIVSNDRGEQIFEVEERFVVGASNAAMLDFDKSIFITQLKGSLRISGGSERMRLVNGDNHLSILPIADIPIEIDYGTFDGQISLRWITGIDDSNTNDDNEITVDITVTGANYVVELFNGVTRIGYSTSQAVDILFADITADNSSGISGKVYVKDVRNASNITVKYLLSDDIANPLVMWRNTFESVEEVIL